MAISNDGKATEDMMIKAWSKVPGLWQLKITDSPGLGDRPADNILIVENLRILQEVKSTTGDAIRLGSLIHKHQVKNLYDFQSLHKDNIGLIVVEFLTHKKLVFIDIIQYIKHLKRSAYNYLGLPEILKNASNTDLSIYIHPMTSGAPEMTKIFKEVQEYAVNTRKHTKNS